MNRLIKIAKMAADGATEPLTVDELKLYLQIQGTAYDAQLATYITAARRMVESQCRRSLIDSETTAVISVRSTNYTPIPYYPLDAFTQVRWKKCPQQVLDQDEGYDYLIDGNMISFLKYGEWWLDYTTTADTDPTLIEAVKIQSGFMYTNRDNPQVSGWHPQAKAILSSYGA